jgi:hypothetical protein
MLAEFCSFFPTCPTLLFVNANPPNRIFRRAFLCLAGAAVGSSVLGCGGSPTAPERDQVFYLHERGVIDRRYSWERYFPPLDRDKTNRLPRRVGVAIFEGKVRLARPIDWYLRTADNTPEKRLISYQSPRQFQFNIYERIDTPVATWDMILSRYEADVKSAKSTIIAGRIPIATANAQGRSYLIKTAMKAKPENYETFAHEILIRSPERVLLVQVVHNERIDETVDEMLDAIKSMLVY